MTEHNIFQEIQEDLERQKLEALWTRFGSYIVAAALAIVITTGAVTVWRSVTTEHEQTATAGLIDLGRTHDSDTAKKIGAMEAFAAKNPGKVQSTFAQLHAAALAANNGDKAKAAQIYDQVAQDDKVDNAFRQLATLMSVQVQLDVSDPVALQKQLQPLLAENAPWRFTAMEYSGYLALRSGDKAKAKTIFTELSQNTNAPQSLSERAGDMLRYVNE